MLSFRPTRHWLALLATTVATAAWPSEDTGDAYRRYLDAYSRGQIEEALQCFTDDARVVAGPNCTAAVPCIGRRAIAERYIVPLLALKADPPLTDQRYDGERLRTRGEASYVIGADGSVRRLMGGHVFEFRQGRISSLSYAFDTSDVETAQHLENLLSAARLAQAGAR